MLQLLRVPSITAATRAHREQQALEKSSTKSSPSPTSMTTSSPTKKKEEGNDGPVAMPQLGDGAPLANYAILHTGGAHYVMIRRT